MNKANEIDDMILLQDLRKAQSAILHIQATKKVNEEDDNYLHLAILALSSIILEIKNGYKTNTANKEISNKKSTDSVTLFKIKAGYGLDSLN